MDIFSILIPMYQWIYHTISMYKGIIWENHLYMDNGEDIMG